MGHGRRVVVPLQPAQRAAAGDHADRRRRRPHLRRRRAAGIDLRLAGLGQYALQAIERSGLRARLQGFVIYASLLYVLAFLLVDLLYMFIDPRIRCMTVVLDRGSPKAAPRRKRRPRSYWALRIGLAVLVFYAAVALISFVWTPYDPLTPGIGDGYDAPSWAFPLGTDRLGSDMLSRLMVGARYDLGIAFVAVTIALTIGTIHRRRCRLSRRRARHRGDARASRSSRPFPACCSRMLVVQAVGAGIVNVILVLSFVGIPDYLRLARAEIHARQDLAVCRGGAHDRQPAVAGRLPPSAAQQRRAAACLHLDQRRLLGAGDREPGLPGSRPRPQRARVGQHDRPRPGRRHDRPMVGVVLPGPGDPRPDRRPLPAGRRARPTSPTRGGADDERRACSRSRITAAASLGETGECAPVLHGVSLPPEDRRR